MNLIPDPLHPAIVHFPIVLILFGTLASFVAVFWRKGYVPGFAAALLTLGAVGAWIAVETGESDDGLADGNGPAVEQLVEAHEDWAKRTLTFSVIAGVFALGAAALFRYPRVARGVGVAAALAAGVASWAVYETGHRGGVLVYRHGVGLSRTPAARDTQALAPPQAVKGHEDKDRD